MDTASYGQNMTGFGQSYGEMDGHLLRMIKKFDCMQNMSGVCLDAREC